MAHYDVLQAIYFNPRSHERSDAMFVGNNEFGIFQSTLPREERHNCLSFKILLSLFQSTLPREERLYSPLEVLPIKLFQSTLPREERLIQIAMSHFTTAFQSTLPREERQLCTKQLFSEISIHAPTRGATLVCNCSFCSNPISIHAPTRGATNRLQLYFLRQVDFNPRSHERSD